jgi:glycosyltransferase involved in cell wall biosynthesis
MKQVDIIRPSSINAINGPIGTLKRILKNREFFENKGYDVTLFVNESLSQGPFRGVPTTTMSGKESHLSGLRKKISLWLRSRARTDFWAAKIINQKNRRQAEKLVDYYLSLDRKPDIIQFHSDDECFFYLKKHKGPQPKMVLFQHTDGIPFRMLTESLPGLKNSNYLNVLKGELDFIVERVNHLVFIAKIGQKNFLKYYPTRNVDNTSVIINGIDTLTKEQIEITERIKAQSHTPKYRFCCTGTISFRKGQHMILEALTELPEKLRNEIRVDLIGDGAERLSLEQYAAEKGIAKQVRFLGSVPNVDVFKLLAECNIYILMSNNEGLPISIIEAMRVGLPIISTNVSGIPELIDEGYNGFLLNPDVKELTSLLKKLPEFDWEQMGRNSKKRFENEFTFERMEKEFCDMYDKLTRD